jgi:hypothetical protein
MKKRQFVCGHRKQEKTWMGWFHLAEDRIRWQAVVNTVKAPSCPIKGEEAELFPTEFGNSSKFLT